MLNTDKIFLLNYKPLTERLKHLVKEFEKTKLINQLEIIQDEPDYDTINELFYTKYMTPQEISLAYKHYIALNKSKNLNSCVIIEDDVIFNDGWINKFNNWIKDTPKDWDCIFFGSGLDMTIKNYVHGVHVYKKEHPATRCTDSMVFSNKGINKILSNLLPIKKPIDHHFNDNFYLNQLNVYWWEPGLCKQGSQKGIYESAIR